VEIRSSCCLAVGILFRMRVLVVLTVCIAACLAHGSYDEGNFGSRSGGGRQSNLIDYPFTVEVSRQQSRQQPQQQQYRPQPQQQQYRQQPQQQQFRQQPQQQRQINYPRPQQQQQRQSARSQTQYIDIPYIVESQQSQQQQPQTRSFQEPRQQIRQQAPPSFQIERSQPVASFDLPSPRPQRQQRQQQQQRSSFNTGGNTRPQSRLIDYPFTVEIVSSGGSTGGNGGGSYGNSNSNYGQQRY